MKSVGCGRMGQYLGLHKKVGNVYFGASLFMAEMLQ